MNTYKVLSERSFKEGEYSLVPIRYEDRYAIMQWRNEQIYHLRQSEPLTKEKQDWYFDNVVSELFDQEKPNQILFSFLKNDECIAYGGLVHINWLDKNAEVSFVMDTDLESEEFSELWSIYLTLLEQAAFEDLNIMKLYVYAFDLRPHLYSTLERNEYFLDARLTKHCYFNKRFIDVVIYSKLNSEIN